MKKDLNNNIIVQSNYLVEAHYRLSLQEKRLILWLIKEINLEDTDFKKYTLNISDFSQIIGLNINAQYSEMKKITKSLITRPIEINNVKLQETIQMSWLCFARWEAKKGVCSLEFHPELKPYLLQLKKQFTKISFSEFLGLKSVYSTRIFELLSQYKSLGKRKMTIEEIKGWCGINSSEYKLYAHLKSRIINKAKNEINEKTDYEIDYVEIKDSRKIVAIEWSIKKKSYFEKEQLKKLDVIQKELRSDLALIEALSEYGFSKAMAKRLIKNNEEITIKNAINSVDIQIKKGQAKNPKAMLQVAIQEKWHPEIFRKK